MIAKFSCLRNMRRELNGRTSRIAGRPILRHFIHKIAERMPRRTDQISTDSRYLRLDILSHSPNFWLHLEGFADQESFVLSFLM
ncbi:hypothetical protein VTK56DRAFT_1491 [Thermocarpiscus australiensis]